MKHTKILFLDVDDTLLCTDKSLTPENREAIRRALAAGHQIVICSGRPLGGILPLAESLSLTAPGCFLIAFNGAVIYDCGARRTVYRTTLPLPDVRILFEKAREHGLYIHTYDEHGLLTCRETEESRFYLSRIPIGARYLPDLPDCLTQEPEKALVICLNGHDRLERYRRDAAPALAGRISLFYSSSDLLECVREGTSKGAAVRWLCSHLGIPIENAFAAGDSENDLPMLEAAGTGCAMANASQACKDAADYITERDCNHSGVAEIIYTFLGTT